MATNKVLIDTNVCLDAAKRRKPFAKHATEILSRSEGREYNGFIAAHSFDTIFYFLLKKYSKSNAYKAIKGLRKAIQVSPVTQKVIDGALNLEWNDFEDAIHHESARAAGCEAIITRNKKDFEQADLKVLTPTEFLDQLNQQ